MITPWDTPALDEASAWAERGLRALAASPDGRTLWGALGDRVVGWEVPSGRALATIDGGYVLHLAVTDDAVVTGAQGWSRWAKEQGVWRRVAHQPLEDRRVLALGHADGAALLRGDRGRTFWGASDRKIRTAFVCACAALRADGAMAAAVGRRSAGDERLLIFDRDGEERCRAALGSGFAALAWAGDDVLAGSAKGVLRYSPQRRRSLWSSPTHNVFALAASRDERTVVALVNRGDGAAAVVFLRANDGAALGEWTLVKGALAWSRDGVTRAVDAGARLSVMLRATTPLAVAPDGSWCALACEQGVVILGAEGELLAVPGHGFGEVRAAEWTPDGRVVVAYDNSPAVRVLRPGAREADFVFEHDGTGTYEIYPSPDGRRVAVHARGTGDHGLRLHGLHDGSHVEVRAEAMAGVEWVEWTDTCDALWVACWLTDAERRPRAFVLWRVDAATGAARHVWTRDGLSPVGGWHQSLHRVGESLWAALPRACLALDPVTGAVLWERPWAAPPFCFLDDDRVLTRGGTCVELTQSNGALRALGEHMETEVVHAASRAWALLYPFNLPSMRSRSPREQVLRARATENGALLGEFEVANGWRARLSRDGRGLAAIHEKRLRLYRVDAEALEAAAERAAGGGG